MINTTPKILLSILVQKGASDKEVSGKFSFSQKPVIQKINISMYAYEHMISKHCPHWVKSNVWSKMNRTLRMESYLNRTCQNYNGLSYSYKLLDTE